MGKFGKRDGEIAKRKMKTSCSEKRYWTVRKQKSHFVTSVFKARGA